MSRLGTICSGCKREVAVVTDRANTRMRRPTIRLSVHAERERERPGQRVPRCGLSRTTVDPGQVYEVTDGRIGRRVRVGAD